MRCRGWPYLLTHPPGARALATAIRAACKVAAAGNVAVCVVVFEPWYYVGMFRVFSLFFVTAALSFGAQSDQVGYGKYLVEEVGKCQECHTARLETGELDQTRWLKGAALDFQPTKEVKGWHKTSPDLTPGGRLWQRWGEQGIVKFLETGAGPSGHPADPPMPAYKLKPADAEAIVAYLKTLK